MLFATQSIFTIDWISTRHDNSNEIIIEAHTNSCQNNKVNNGTEYRYLRIQFTIILQFYVCVCVRSATDEILDECAMWHFASWMH